jgi:hypothetical protein
MQKRVVCVLFVFLAICGFVFAQATAEINGRVVDQAQAVAPGVNVTVTNVASGAVRTSVTNAEGLYSIPALTPGNYNVKAELKGFSPVERNVELLIGGVLSVDLQLQVGAVQQSVSVEAQAELIESTQGTIAGTMRTQEVQELPILNRTVGSLMALTPGAREIATGTSSHGASSNFVSFGGGGGGNYNMLVDGVDNHEYHCGGTAIPYSLEGVQEFKVLNTGATAEYGMATATVILATKSGTNQIHGTGFLYGRNQDLVRTDYFSDPAHGGLGKAPFSRLQFGGSVGGPIIKDKVWYFASVEDTRQNYSTPRPGLLINQLNALTSLNVGSYPPLGLLIGGSVPQPIRDLLIQGKVNYQLTANNSLFLRYSSENGYVDNDFFSGKTGLLSWAPGYSDQNNQKLFGGAMGETWVINNRTVNQFTAQWLGFEHDNKFPVCPYNVPALGIDSCVSEHLVFPSVTVGPANGFPDFTNISKQWEFKDDLSNQLGRHSLKFGVDFNWLPVFGGVFGSATPGSLNFFDDPLTILNNTNGKYPQGFQTPGALSSLTLTSSAGGTYWSKDNYEFGAYVQDDFKVSRKLTLNLGLRYDIYNLFNTQANLATNRVYQILKTIGSPYAQLPQTPKNDWQPRVGIAYDPKGNGNDVIRASAGIFSNPQIKNTTFYEEVEQQPYVLYPERFVNSKVGVGQLPNFIYGVTPIPAIPPTTLNATYPVNGNTLGYWYDPKQFKNVMSYQYHLGWAHKLGGNSVISVDHTFILGTNGWRWLDINPVINGVRPLASALNAAYGGNILGEILIDESVNRSHYDETQVHYEKRISARASFQVNYVLAWASGMGGVSDGTLKAMAPYPQQPSTTGGNIYAPWEWGPTNYDERHRVTAVGVFTLPFKIEVSPSLTFATARPYTLYSGLNPSGEGGGTQILNSSGTFNGINTQRGADLFVLNARVTRTFKFGERMSLGAFAEIYNITDRANFGNQYGGFSNSPATYQKPTAYLGGIGSVSSIPNSFQVQFGGRFTF